jgi:endonuclease YncB( thermonuclease family)
METERVIGITDGDVFHTIDTAGKRSTIRIWGIDAPELGQTWGQEAKDTLSGMIDGKEVSIEGVGIDKYGRRIGRVTVDGMDVGTRMIEGGNAWVYNKFVKYTDDNQMYLMQKTAYVAARGLWSLPNDFHIPPWLWRRVMKKLKKRR